MMLLNEKAPEGVIIFNYAQSKVKLPTAEEIPTLNEAAFKALSDGDPAPFFKVEAIDYPAKGSMGVYEKSFFNSFIGITKERPIPGSKRGHEFTSRPSSDFYTVGGRLDAGADNKSGTAFLKIYIPPKGDTTDNAGFIRDAKAGIVHFSIVTTPEYTVKRDGEHGEEIRHFTSSKGYERNDAVEYGTGAMAQIVNASILLDFDAAKALIEAGQFDRESKIDGSPLQNGIVYRTALRRLQSSRAYDADAPKLAELISMIDKTKNNGRKTVDKEEAIKVLSNLIKNGAENVPDLAQAMGFGERLRNDADVKNAALVQAVTAKLGEKPMERIDTLIAENAAGMEAARENAIVALVGPAKNADGKPNVRYEHVMAKTAGLSGEKLANALEALKQDPVMQVLNAQAADVNSPLNRIEGGRGGWVQDSYDGIPTTRIGGK